MSRNRSLRDPEILELPQNIPEDQSDCEQTEEERRILQLDSDSEESDYNPDLSSDDDECTHSDSDDSLPLSALRSTNANVRRGQGRRRIRSRGRSQRYRGQISRAQSEVIYQDTDGVVSSNGVLWSPGNLSASEQPGQLVSQSVMILSSLHPNVFVNDSEQKKKPNTVKFYNSKKIGVDVIDQMAKKYSVKVQDFYNILDLAAINSWILYKKLTDKKITRKKFILYLARELVGQETHDSQIPSTSQPSTESLQELEVEQSKKRRQCSTQKCRNKTSKHCDTCNKPLCGSCNVNKKF